MPLIGITLVNSLSELYNLILSLKLIRGHITECVNIKSKDIHNAKNKNDTGQQKNDHNIKVKMEHLSNAHVPGIISSSE